LVIVLTLGLGIGANSAMFSLAYTVIVAPYDHLPDSAKLVVPQQTNARGVFMDSLTPATFLALRDGVRTVSLAAFTDYSAASVGASDGTRRVRAVAVSDGFFATLGVEPFLGRAFTPEETSGHGAAVVILDHSLWLARFGGDQAIVGRTLTVDGAPHVVVGVMPPRQAFPTGTEMWRPLAFTAADREDRREARIESIGRLRPDASVAQAHAEMVALDARELADHPELTPRTTRVVTINEANIDQGDRSFFFMLVGAAALVLLITCANVTNVFLAAATARRREHAVRAALGAGRGRIAAGLLVETLLLGICASGLALLFAAWGIDFIHSSLLPASFLVTIPGWDRLGVNGTVLGYTLALGLATGLIFGIVPAIQVSRANLHDVLKAGGRGGESAGAHRLRGALVVAQIALAMCLLVVSAGLVRVYSSLAEPPRSVDADHVATAFVEVPAQHVERSALPALAARLVDRVGMVPGAEVAVVNQVPWGRNPTYRVLRVEGRPAPEPGRPGPPSVAFRAATPGYLQLLHIPVIAGRGLEARDVATAPRVAVLSQAAGRVYFPDEDPIGKRVGFDGDDGEGATIVGVVGDLRERFGQATPTPNIYVPFAQRPQQMFYVTVRTPGAPADVFDALRTGVTGVDPALSVWRELSLMTVMEEQASGMRAGATMITTFAALALILASIGVYGVIAFLVAQRTREIGVRMALGARRRQVIGMVVGRGARLAALGIGIGAVVAVGVLKLLGAAIPGNIDADASVFALVAALVTLAAIAGSFIPARRAAEVDPMVALRED
jgi:putative ABC transport system permease protein